MTHPAFFTLIVVCVLSLCQLMLSRPSTASSFLSVGEPPSWTVTSFGPEVAPGNTILGPLTSEGTFLTTGLPVGTGGAPGVHAVEIELTPQHSKIVSVTTSPWTIWNTATFVVSVKAAL